MTKFSITPLFITKILRTGVLFSLICILNLYFRFNFASADVSPQEKYKIPAYTNTSTPSEKFVALPQETGTQTPTPTATQTQVNIDTPTPTHTPSPSVTSTAESEFTETPTATATSSVTPPIVPIIYAPFVVDHWLVSPVEMDIENYLICDSLNSSLQIPDNDPNGVEDQINVEKGGLVVDIEIYLNVDHTWVGDLRINLTHENSNYNSVLIDRPGLPNAANGCGLDNLRTILDDQASQPAEMKCLSYPAAIAGIYQPMEKLSRFRGIPASGSWRLSISDSYEADEGKLNEWCLNFSLSNRINSPTPTPTPMTLPDNARIYGIYGEDQALPLDCESRSAVDWARYFGRSIGEVEFLNNLPGSDNPDAGFVGDVNGVWGQIPPHDYGVHAEPVAELLRDYGLTAAAKKSMTWDEVKREISLSRPVIAWVIGSVINGAPEYYTSQSDQKTTIVAKYEHTVIVIGYSPDSVTILDGDDIYTRPLNRFLESWSSLNNMGVIARSPEE